MRKILVLLIVIGAVVGARMLVKKYTGPGDDILIPEGATPSWMR